MKPKPIAFFPPPPWTTFTANYQLLCPPQLLLLALGSRSTHPSAHFSGHFSPVLSPSSSAHMQPSSACNQNSTGGCWGVAGPDGTAWALALFIIHARPPPRCTFSSSLPSIPSSTLLLSQRAMDLLKGITKKARCYRAYILTNTMQEGEERSGGEEKCLERRWIRHGRKKHKR